MQSSGRFEGDRGAPFRAFLATRMPARWRLRESPGSGGEGQYALHYLLISADNRTVLCGRREQLGIELGSADVSSGTVRLRETLHRLMTSKRHHRIRGDVTNYNLLFSGFIKEILSQCTLSTASSTAPVLTRLRRLQVLGVRHAQKRRSLVRRWCSRCLRL